MPTPDRITEIINEMDRNPELANALRARILGEGLLQIPAIVQQNQDQIILLMEKQAELSSIMLEKFNAFSQALAELAVAVATLAERVDRMETRMDGMETRIDRMETRMNSRMDRMESGISDIKGLYTEQKTIRQVKVITTDLDLQYIRALPPQELALMAKKAAGGAALTDELRSFRNADLVVEVRDEDGTFQYLAVEASFTADKRDTSRAIRNAELLTQFTGHRATAVVASVRNDEEAQTDIETRAIHWHPIGD